MTHTERVPLDRRDFALLGGFALFKFLMHIWANFHAYGYFRDELYFLICGERLAWGYVDQPPLVAVVARLGRALFGDSLVAIRILPAACGAAKVVVAGLLTRELGGGRAAMALVCAAMILTPMQMAHDNFLSMNTFDQLFWLLAIWVLVRLIRTENPRLWLWFGAVVGVGLENKYSVLFFLAAFAAGLLLTSLRRHILSGWLWAAAGLALLIWLPNLYWQYTHGWPQFELLRNADIYKNYHLSPLEFLSAQVLEQNVLALPLWGAGVLWLFFGREGKRYRLVACIYVIVFVLFVLTRGKPYYIAPVYPALFAAGGVALERVSVRPRLAWVPVAAFLLILVGGIAFAPFALPVVPEEQFIAYAAGIQRALGVAPTPTERHRMGPLPQHFADMHGWPEMVATVARVYQSLPAEDRAKACIYGENYGEAGAVDFFGRKYGLPHAISGHNNYWLWGPGTCSGEIIITIGVSAEDAGQSFEQVAPAARFFDPYAMPYEYRNPLLICRKPRLSMKEIWPKTKVYV